MQRDSLLSYLDDFSKYSNRACFLFDDGFRTWSYSYDQILNFIENFAARLQSIGLRTEDKVVFWSENRQEWIVAFWACLKLKVMVVPLDYRSSADYVSRIQRIVLAKLLLIGDETQQIDLGVPVWTLSFQDRDWQVTTKTPRHLEISATSTVEIVFTSGATGEPKGVVITHKNILANLIPVEEEIGKYRRYLWLVSPIRFLNLLPLSHMFGQVLSTFIPQMLGGVVAFQKGYNPRDAISLIRRQRISVLVCVPKLLDVVMEYVKREFPETLAATQPESLPIWRRWWKYRRVHARFGFKFWAFVVGAAPLPRNIEDFWHRLGFLTVQGYGLTETAPIVSVNHPFSARRGSLGKPIAGLEVKLAEDGEILIRGENVTPGYYHAPEETARAFQDGWFRTGDIGEMDAEGRLYYRGRKKEMIVTPEGLNVFPEDVEKVLNSIPGVQESAVVGITENGEERAHAVVILSEDQDLSEIRRTANKQLEDYQKIRSISEWPEKVFPRTEGTQKLKRNEIRAGVLGQKPGVRLAAGASTVEELLAQFAGRSPDQLREEMKLSEDLGLSSLEKVELLVALEDRFHVSVDDHAFSQAQEVADLKRLVSVSQPAEPVLQFPSWQNQFWARILRRLMTAAVIVPLTRIFAWLQIKGREHLPPDDAPLLFAANHQSHMDAAVIKCALPRRFRFDLAPAMSMEFFSAHFWPQNFPLRKRIRYGLDYYLACLFFNGFPLPQHQLGARQSLRYMGELIERGNSILVFPEGVRSPDGKILPFQAGIGLMAAFLKIPVVPIRIDGLQNVLPLGAHFARPGRVRVAFGEPMRFEGADYTGFAKGLEEAIRKHLF